MKTLLPLILSLALLTGCAGGLTPTGADPSLAPSSSAAPSSDPSAPAEGTAGPTPAPTSTPEPTPTPTPYDYAAPVPEGEAVDDGWFADTAFVGDSRTDGLYLYGGIYDADYFSYKGLTVFEVLEDKPVIQTADGLTGVLTALAQKEYTKIYICLGLNELGYNYDEGFRQAYSALVDELKALQPEADLYLQAIVPVSTEVCEATHQADYVNNAQIGIYNDIIRAIAENQQVYFLDLGEAYVDENGELPADASSDGIHFHKEGYQVWADYLRTHIVEDDRP